MFSNATTEHGCKHESVVIKAYEKVKKENTLIFMLKLVVRSFIKRYPWLHATPGFLCYCTLCDCYGEGCREVKCPHCLKDTDLKSEKGTDKF